MSKKYRSKVLTWIMDVFPKGIAVFAVAAGAFYAYAASITFPAVDPYPVSGVVGQFIGLTTGGYTPVVTDYQRLNDECRLGMVEIDDPQSPKGNLGAHVCSPMEIINSYNYNPAFLAAQTGTGIINAGPPGYTVFANDCNGWTVRTATHQNTPAFGSVWSFDEKSASLATCDLLTNDQVVKIACCK